YLISENELYVIEVNPRASRTVPYISKVTGVPMVDLAAGVMTGGDLADLGYGTGLYQAPPYVTVKVPVFSFGKLSDANSYMGPELKSTGEVLGIGKNIREALFKGMTSAGFRLQNPRDGGETGIFISVDDHDYGEIIGLSRKVRDLGMTVYATPGTAETIQRLGIPVHVVPGIREQDGMWKLLEEGKIHYIVYTGALYDETLSEYIALHRKALTLGVLCLTSLDTANAMADVIASGYSEKNTELVDLNAMRRDKRTIAFSKMEGSGDDYILLDARETPLDGAESLAVELCDRRFGIGADGMVVLLPSNVADVKMRICNRDGSDGVMAGNSIRCVGKYLYDNGFVSRDVVTVETEAGIRELTLHTSFGRVTMVGVNMGKPKLRPGEVPCTLDGDAVIDRKIKIGGTEYRVTCLSVGNPHCVVFTDHPEKIDLSVTGPQFEYAPLFPERVNTEFVRVVSPTVLSMRVYERGNGETAACGTGAVAAAVAAVLNGYCKKDSEITVELPGGDLSVCVKENGDVILTGDTHLVYTGSIIR
ncbi:MAG: diaminopimelate epimerase, partial [Clostridia bacterium]|nr:diaminopimelate epimerase [Clostridia bacterium]